MYYYTKFEKIQQVQSFWCEPAAAENTLDNTRLSTV